MCLFVTDDILKANADVTREFVSDVIAHQADLRFITMAAQKFEDESNEYLGVLNNFRDILPQKMKHIQPRDLLVKAEVAEVTGAYQVTATWLQLNIEMFNPHCGGGVEDVVIRPIFTCSAHERVSQNEGNRFKLNELGTFSTFISTFYYLSF